MIVNLMMQNYLYGAFRWPWISELYEYVQSVHLLPAVISVILNPRKPTFKVTAKDESITPAAFPKSACRSSSSSRAAGRRRRDRLPSTPSPIKADVTLVVGGWNLLIGLAKWGEADASPSNTPRTSSTCRMTRVASD